MMAMMSFTAIHLGGNKVYHPQGNKLHKEDSSKQTTREVKEKKYPGPNR